MGGCGCGKKLQRPAFPDGGVTAAPDPALNESGMITLAGYEDCATAHSGPLMNDSVLVVGRGTPHQRLFLRRQLAEANTYRRSLNDRSILLHRVQGGKLCDDAVNALLAESAAP